jgi:flagellar hook-associated protein 1 FlgK
MPGLFSALVSSAESLRVFEKSIATCQNNVTNALTPGFAKQRLALRAALFNPDEGLPGGVISGGLESSRDEYAEQAVRFEAQYVGRFEQKSTDLGRVEQLFDVTGDTGIPSSLNKLFQSFSAWSVTANDAGPRQNVLDAAGEVAASFNETANGLGREMVAADQQIRDQVDAINNLTGSIRDLNVQIRQDFRSRSDPSLDARMHDTLEKLASYVDLSVLHQADGSVTLLIGGRTPLVVGDKQYTLHADFSSTEATVLDENNADMTGLIKGGSLGSLLETRNTTIPGYVSDLNRLAKQVADDINATLAGGVDMNGDAGAPLFTYNTVDDAGMTMAVTGITTAQLAGADPASPGGNANALNLVDLAIATPLDGLTYTGFYARLATTVGQGAEGAQNDLETHQQLLLQAQAMRDEVSKVSLDEEAARLIEFQRSYQATAQMIGVLNELTGVVLSWLD